MPTNPTAGLIALAGAALVAAPLAQSQAPKPVPKSVQKLTWDTYPEVRRETVARPDEMIWDKVRWKASLFEALVEAQEKDRPIFVFMFNGDLRGVC